MINKRRDFSAENLIRRPGTGSGHPKGAGVPAGMTALFRVIGKGDSDMAVASPNMTRSILNGALSAAQLTTVFHYESIVGLMHDADNLNFLQAGLWEQYQRVQLLKTLGGTKRAGSDSLTFLVPDDTSRTRSPARAAAGHQLRVVSEDACSQLLLSGRPCLDLSLGRSPFHPRYA